MLTFALDNKKKISMSKLIGIFGRADGKKLKVYEFKNRLRGVMLSPNGKRVEGMLDFYNTDLYGVKLHMGFNTCYAIPFGRKNGKIVLYPNINKSKRIIWSNDDYDEWCDAMKEEITDEEITPEYYSFCKANDLDDERMNLNIEVDGYIVAFGNLGRWNGRFNGAKLVGTNVNDILYSDCDYITWYCDLHNVRCDETHHDGHNTILYRVADTKEQAERLVDKIAYGNMTEEGFRKATKSLRKYVADVYGW